MNKWSRRKLLGSTLLAGAAGLANTAAPFVRAIAKEGAAGGGDWSADFAARLASRPMLLGWKGPRADRLAGAARIEEGRLPAELRGVLYRNGPSVHERFDLRYRHWFDGDGMVQAFRFDGAAITHRGRVIRTPKLARELAAGRRLYPGFGTPIARAAPVRGPDDLNTANISVLDHHGALLALWEGGSASVLDRETLAWQGFRSWGEGLEGVPFTAHPKVEPDGTLWAFGVSLIPAMRLVLYRIARDGSLVKAQVVDAGPLGMVHDFVVTERHLVIVIPPLVFEPEAAAGGVLLDALAWRPELGSRALVVAKDDFDDRRWHQLPAGFGFHHGNGWEEAGGTIRFDHCVAEDATLMSERFRFIMRGELRAAAPERYTRFTLHPDGRSRVEATPEWAEFPRVAPAVVGRRNRYVYTLGESADDDAGDAPLRQVEKRDLERGTREAFDYGLGVIPEEHVFVPRRGAGAEDDGWLVGTFLDYARGVSGVAVFDARRVGEGPIARASLDYPLPLGFHGCFSPA